jgi:hypothetical protein
MVRRYLVLIVLLTLCSLGSNTEATNTANQTLIRTELYFGPVALADWKQFLGAVVTPRFPQGLTWYDVHGQWQDEKGTVRMLDSRVLVILYADSTAANRQVEEIRMIFKQRFHQKSVLRDSEKVTASF